jgi:predicted GNAT superfamily acetyltransferase
MHTNHTPTKTKYRVEVIRGGGYHCVKVTLDPVAAQKCELNYNRLGYLTRIKEKGVRA